MFKLISLNVRGISNFKKRKMMFTWCRKKKTDIIFLQETHSKKDAEMYWKNEWGSEIILSHGSSNSCGVAILVKKGVDCTIHSKILDPSGRYIILKAEIEDKMYILINIYAPNKDTNIVTFFNNLLMTLRKNDFDEEENIIGGDFNCPPNPLLDKKGGLLIPRKSRRARSCRYMENQESCEKKLHMEPKFSHDFLSIGLLADFKFPT